MNNIEERGQSPVAVKWEKTVFADFSPLIHAHKWLYVRGSSFIMKFRNIVVELRRICWKKSFIFLCERSDVYILPKNAHISNSMEIVQKYNIFWIYQPTWRRKKSKTYRISKNSTDLDIYIRKLYFISCSTKKYSVLVT